MGTIAIYGAGPSLGQAVARRFGREGFRVALVARDPEQLGEKVRALADEGIEAAGFPADIADPAAALRAADEIEARFGAIDVLEHSPTPGRLFAGLLELEPATVSALVDLYLLTPIALVNRLLPGMRERGKGSLLFTMGAAAVHPIPQFAAVSAVLPGLRGYIHTLHQTLAEEGVYAGALIVGALIEGSAAHRNAAAFATEGRQMPTVSPEDLADRLWALSAQRDRVEEILAPALEPRG
ncbi:SDR family NAD(P)-dependent oxidoreductase [Actinospica robiniae]|uniref:SDR family NAD(P)-dependent oxidoreductase n=1 Tax=Actinospica robiniae TaxID=304901 RepID=UPI00041777A4|nr:SDR family oxidoreductase [Actinospica robiniae]